MFRVIIAGGRDFKDYDLLVKTMNHLLSNIKDEITVVCGKARGADTLGEQYAKEHGYSVQYFPADGTRHSVFSVQFSLAPVMDTYLQREM